MDLIEALAGLEEEDDLHAARILILLRAFAASDGGHEIEGLTKLAKLDFLLRYPVLLERALVARRRSPAPVNVLPYERDSVESRMVRYRFGPWDHRYRRFLNVLIARGLVDVQLDGKTFKIGLMPKGREVAERLVGETGFEDLARRAQLLKAALDLPASRLMKFVYDTFPEIMSLEMGEAI